MDHTNKQLDTNTIPDYNAKAMSLTTSVYDKIIKLYEQKNTSDFIMTRCKKTLQYHEYLMTKINHCKNNNICMQLTETNNKFIKEIINNNNFLNIKDTRKYNNITEFFDDYSYKLNKNIKNAKSHFDIIFATYNAFNTYFYDIKDDTKTISPYPHVLNFENLQFDNYENYINNIPNIINIDSTEQHIVPVNYAFIDSTSDTEQHLANNNYQNEGGDTPECVSFIDETTSCEKKYPNSDSDNDTDNYDPEIDSRVYPDTDSDEDINSAHSNPIYGKNLNNHIYDDESPVKDYNSETESDDIDCGAVCECEYEKRINHCKRTTLTKIKDIKNNNLMITNVRQFNDALSGTNNNILKTKITSINKLLSNAFNTINELSTRKNDYIENINRFSKFNQNKDYIHNGNQIHSYRTILNKNIKYIKSCSNDDAKKIYNKMTQIMCNILPFFKKNTILTDHIDKMIGKYYNFLDIDADIDEISFSMILMNPVIYKTLLFQYKSELQFDQNNIKSEKIINKILNCSKNQKKQTKSKTITKEPILPEIIINNINSSQELTSNILIDDCKTYIDPHTLDNKYSNNRLITVSSLDKEIHIQKIEDEFEIKERYVNMALNDLTTHFKNIFLISLPILPTIKDVLLSEKLIIQGNTFFKYKNNKPYYNRSFWFPDNGKYIYRKDRRCKECDSVYVLTKDHIIPASCCGNNKIYNLQTLCYDCNENKASYISVKHFEIGRICYRYIDRFQYELNYNPKFRLLKKVMEDPYSCSLTETANADTLLYNLLKTLRFEYNKNLHYVLQKLCIVNDDVEIPYRTI